MTAVMEMAVDGPVAVRERLEAFADEMLTDVDNQPMQLTIACICGG